MALIPLKTGEVAAIVTRFEMTQRPKPAPLLSSPLRLARWKEPEPDKYRILFRRVGEHWLWYSRLVMSDHALRATIRNPLVEVHAVLDPKGIEVGLLELDFRHHGLCIIAFLGLVPQLTGQGLGPWLLSQALSLAWRKGVTKISVQTYSLDDPRAISLYIKAGFAAIHRSIDIFPDPRLSGLLPMSAAHHVPVVG
ncbi:MAG: GNAT family N-acetyltransferase [Sphingobium sp.]|nr:GNAT family N-acetyltransferase [Sphingobium sp.]MBP6111723.1 GNAT family N-acetyltransferase [Sphingobium sp.]MBP8671270.1 GNAT family N-acetyltransferase [Sphingobium sp.]MBP9158379.1 GNAT family N-acetyltransferase [Sphingobium sp.]